MDRRTVLTSVGASLSITGAGCLSRSNGSTGENDGREESGYFNLEHALSPDRAQNTVTEITTGHSDLGKFSTRIRGFIADEPLDEPHNLEEFDSAIQREAVLAITRSAYHGMKGSQFALHADDIPNPLFLNFGGKVIHIRSSTGHPAYLDLDFVINLELDATLDDGALTLTATNEDDEPYEIWHYGRPKFGVLLAWDGEPHLLGHDRYEENEEISTQDETFVVDSPQRSQTELESDESVTETYIVPEGIEGKASIWLTLPFYRDDESSPRYAVWEIILN